LNHFTRDDEAFKADASSPCFGLADIGARTDKKNSIRFENALLHKRGNILAWHKFPLIESCVNAAFAQVDRQT